MDLEQLLAIARGALPADLLLRNARILELFSGEIVRGDVALAGERIAAVDTSAAGAYAARETIDLEGRFLAPGLIDSHVHVESALVPPPQFARAVLPRGTTTVVTDPHEIANVHGLDGIRFMLAASRDLPLTCYVNLPSCVPSTTMETAGATLTAADLATLKDEPRVLGLAEVMNFPGVVAGDQAILAKIAAFRGRVLDGHAPGLGGPALNAYAAAGIGSDHECTTVAEAREKLQRGLVVFIREATNAHNLEALLPLVTPANERRLCLCTDDRQPPDLLQQGGIDFMLRTAIAAGIPPLTAWRMATLNPAEYFGLSDRGAIAPGRRADLVVFSDLQEPVMEMVFSAGSPVARDGRLLAEALPAPPPAPPPSMNIAWDQVDFSIPAAGERVRVIGALPGQLLTEALVVDTPRLNGLVVADPARDLLKMAVVERHRGSGNVGLGLVQGLGLKRGALASTVAHDHHNLVVAGADDRSMLTAARAVAAGHGGMAVAVGGDVLATLPLPIAGLMSDQPIEAVAAQLARLLDAAHALGSPLHDPFMALSFLALPVIPALKLTDRGLVDVANFRPVSLFV